MDSITPEISILGSTAARVRIGRAHSLVTPVNTEHEQTTSQQGGKTYVEYHWQSPVVFVTPLIIESFLELSRS